MAVNNNIVSKPISIREVAKLIGYGGNDLGKLCSSKLVNMWSKHKPFRFHAIFIDDSQRETILVQEKYGLHMPVFRAKSNTCILNMANGVIEGTAMWGYLPPRGKGTEFNEPFRLEDFNGYCHTTNWEEGYTPNLPQIINFPLNICVQAGVIDGLGYDTILTIVSQDFNNVNDAVLSTSDLMNVILEENSISSMYVGIALIPEYGNGVELSTEKIHVWLTGMNIQSIINDSVLNATSIGQLEGDIYYYIAPFLYYGLTYESGTDTSHTVPLSNVKYSNTTPADAVVSYIGNRKYKRLALAKRFMATSVSLSLGTDSVATITFEIGDKEITYTRLFFVLCSDEVIAHDYFNDVEVPYGDMTYDWMMDKNDNALSWANITAGGGGLTISTKINSTVTSGSCTASSPMAVRAKNNTSIAFGYAVDITSAIGILQKNKTYTLSVTFSGRVSDSGGNFNNAYMFFANNSEGYSYSEYVPIP